MSKIKLSIDEKEDVSLDQERFMVFTQLFFVPLIRPTCSRLKKILKVILKLIHSFTCGFLWSVWQCWTNCLNL